VIAGWLDRTPTIVRDLIMTVSGAAAFWAGSDLVPWLSSRGDAWSLVAPLVAVIAAAVTKATRAYGRGHESTPHVQPPTRHTK
jgi:hypothetical protein